MGPPTLRRPDLSGSNVSRVRRPIAPEITLGQGLLPANAGQGSRPSPRRPRLGLQVGAHNVSVLARPYALRRGPLPASSQAPRLASGCYPESARNSAGPRLSKKLDTDPQMSSWDRS